MTTILKGNADVQQGLMNAQLATLTDTRNLIVGDAQTQHFIAEQSLNTNLLLVDIGKILIGGFQGLTLPSAPVVGHAAGIERVQRPGFYFLHPEERVQPAREATAMRALAAQPVPRAGGEITVNVTVHGGGESPDALAQSIARETRRTLQDMVRYGRLGVAIQER